MPFSYKSKDSDHQDDMGLDKLPSSTQEFFEFTPWVRLAYVCRCTRRSQPMIRLFWKDVANADAETIENAIAHAERIASDPLIIRGEVQFQVQDSREMAAEAAALAYCAMQVEETAKENYYKQSEDARSPSPIFSCRSAHYAAACADATIEVLIAQYCSKVSDEERYIHDMNRADGRARQNAKHAVEAAYIAIRSAYSAYEMYTMMWRDFEIATQLSRHVKHDPQSLAYPRMFGDLWPTALMIIPDWWPRD